MIRCAACGKSVNSCIQIGNRGDKLRISSGCGRKAYNTNAASAADLPVLGAAR